MVSIHATLAGGDNWRAKSRLCTPHVSIHATLAGGDYLPSAAVQPSTVFLSTPPSRVATKRGLGQWRNSGVSIHATLAGGDQRSNDLPELSLYVSIHATLAGGDALRQRSRYWNSCFYPRHPRGWRPAAPGVRAVLSVVSIHATLAGGDDALVLNTIGYYMFLSTPPPRVATNAAADGLARLYVSIHATPAGGDETGRGGV